MRVGVEIIFRAQSLGRDATKGAALGEDILPKLRRGARLGVDARHADNGNWSGHTLGQSWAAEASCHSRAHGHSFIHYRRFRLREITAPDGGRETISSRSFRLI